MKINYREIEITDEQRAEVKAAMTALYAVCEKHNLPMAGGLSSYPVRDMPPEAVTLRQCVRWSQKARSVHWGVTYWNVICTRVVWIWRYIKGA